jgi:hypothetical protein
MIMNGPEDFIVSLAIINGQKLVHRIDDGPFHLMAIHLLEKGANRVFYLDAVTQITMDINDRHGGGEGGKGGGFNHL